MQLSYMIYLTHRTSSTEVVVEVKVEVRQL